jgi:hypothetical protein
MRSSGRRARARRLSTASGGAYGIDAAAHRGALATQATTIAILAVRGQVLHALAAWNDPSVAEGLLTYLAQGDPAMPPIRGLPRRHRRSIARSSRRRQGRAGRVQSGPGERRDLVSGRDQHQVGHRGRNNLPSAAMTTR